MAQPIPWRVARQAEQQTRYGVAATTASCAPPHLSLAPLSGGLATTFGYGQLIGAQADGDLAVLAGQGRRCLRLDLGGDPAAAVEQLTARLAS